MVDRCLGSMLRFVRNVENWGGVQGTSWVAGTEIAAMSLSLRMRFDAAARVGLGDRDRIRSRSSRTWYFR